MCTVQCIVDHKRSTNPNNQTSLNKELSQMPSATKPRQPPRDPKTSQRFQNFSTLHNSQCDCLNEIFQYKKANIHTSMHSYTRNTKSHMQWRLSGIYLLKKYNEKNIHAYHEKSKRKQNTVERCNISTVIQIILKKFVF